MTTAGVVDEGGGAKACTLTPFACVIVPPEARGPYQTSTTRSNQPTLCGAGHKIHRADTGVETERSDRKDTAVRRLVSAPEESAAVHALGRRPDRQGRPDALRAGPVKALAILALVPALLAGACTSADPQTPVLPSTITIGLLTSRTGQSAPMGLDAIRGAELAIDLVNNPYPDVPLPLGPSAGLRNGVKLGLAIGDTQGAPERVEEQVSRLVRDGAVGLVLADDIAVARSVGRQVDIVGVAMIDATSTADLFSELNRGGHYRIQPSDRSAVQSTMDLLYREHAAGKSIEKVAVAAAPTAVSYNEEAETIRKAINDLGQSDGYSAGPVLPLGAGANAADLASTVTGSKSDVVIAIVTTPQEAAAAIDLAVRLKGSVPVIGIGPAVEALDVTKAGQTEVLRTSGWSAEFTRRNPVAAQVAQLYERRYSTKLTQVATSTFMSTLALAVAADTAKGLSAGEVRGSVQQLAMSATQTIMPWDGIRFDGNGNNQLAASVVEQRTTGGFQVIHPVELAAAPLIWP
jgi:branched-chain amino acid transport system substrate-binding protein